MRSSLTLLMVALLLATLMAGCAAGINMRKGSVNERNVVAGFWPGLWQGFIAPFVYVASLFVRNLNICEVHNNGA